MSENNEGLIAWEGFPLPENCMEKLQELCQKED